MNIGRTVGKAGQVAGDIASFLGGTKPGRNMAGMAGRAYVNKVNR